MVGTRSPDPQTPVLYAAIPADSRTELDSSQKSIAPRFAWSVMTAAALKSSAPSEGLLLDGRLNHTSKQVIGMLGSRKLFQRARRACWLVPLVSSRDNLFSHPKFWLCSVDWKLGTCRRCSHPRSSSVRLRVQRF